MVLENILEVIRDSIRDNIQDPNETRWEKSGDWVFTKPIQTDSTPQYPRIHMQSVSAPRTAHGVNTDRRRVTSRIQMSIWWDTRHKQDPDGGDEDLEPEYALQRLAESVEKHINENNSTWTNTSGVISIYSVDVNDRPTGKKTLIRKDLDIEVIWRTD